jgi:hypothetical protein
VGAEPRGEVLDLVIFGDGRIALGERHEFVAVFPNGVIPVKQRQLTDRALGEGRPEACVDKLNEAIPRRLSVVELDMVVTDLGVVEEIEGGHFKVAVLRGAAEAEVPLATVEPRHRIIGAVEFGEFDFVGRMGPLTAELFVAVHPPTSAIGHCPAADPERWRCNRSIPCALVW